MANTQFNNLEYYLDTNNIQYKKLPFRFDRWDNEMVFLSTDTGESLFIDNDSFNGFVANKLSPSTSIYKTLKSKGVLVDSGSSAQINLLASKYRTKKSFIEGFSKLHIFVTTLRCNLSCPYCQVSRKNLDADASTFDMPIEVLDKSIDIMLQSPSMSVTMEFQGGEPLSNFELIREGVIRAKDKNKYFGKNIKFVICTNLAILEDEHLEFFKEHDFCISTSLDGPAFIHNANRPFHKGGASHDVVVKNIKRCQDYLGIQKVSALMTTTRLSLKYPKEIVDEFISRGLGSMFVRELNPYGFAVKTNKALGYTSEEFIEFYTQCLDYIIELNRKGKCFSESSAAMILSKLLTPWPIGFVDLQSPTGSGFGVTLYNYDGDVYASDESRMLAETGDTTFRLGNVLDDGYEALFFGETMQLLASAACNESLPGCSDCAYQSFCGADPVRNYATQDDVIGNRAEGNGFCKKYMALIKHLLALHQNADDDLTRILWSWINRDDHERMKLKEEQS
jgi:His-Xaa-Ser system radical SAM maturase HxsB